jgi:hypothetical protein
VTYKFSFKKILDSVVKIIFATKYSRKLTHDQYYNCGLKNFATEHATLSVIVSKIIKVAVIAGLYYTSQALL